MTTLARRNSSIHRVREFTLPQISLESEYETVAVLQEGWRGRLLLVEHKLTRNEVVLKAAHKDATSKLEFFREFHYNYYLSPHRNILNAYDVAFLAGDFYMFAQELAPFGDLTSNTSDTGIGEINTKKIACQLASALDFMHSKDLVHRDINMDNVLVFKSDFSKVKLCDFGSTRKTGTLIRKKNVWLPYAPPEIVDAVQNEGYHVGAAQDVWQFGVLIYVLLTGLLPWQKADLTDPHYAEYINWRKRRTLRTPKRLSNFTNRFLRLMKRTLEPKPEKRATVKEVQKYINDKWLVKLVKRDDGDIDNQSCCYSTYSMHSSKLEKDKVLKALKDHGIETTVDRAAKRKRIHEWLERSITSKPVGIEEEEQVSSQKPTVSKTMSSPQPSERESITEIKSNRGKLSTISSMNNILDEGYQTGSSSNNSSIKINPMTSSFAKSTGNIDRLNNERLYNANAQFIIQKLQDQRRGSQSQAQGIDVTPIVNSPLVNRLPRSKLSQAPLPPSATQLPPDNKTAATGGLHQRPALQPAPVQHASHHHHVKDHNQLVKEHNELISQQQQLRLASLNHHAYVSSQHSKDPPLSQNSNPTHTSHASLFLQQPQQQSSSGPTACQISLNSSSHLAYQVNQGTSAIKNRPPRDRQTPNGNTVYDQQRPRHDTPSRLRHASDDEGHSDGSVSSVIVRMNSVSA